MSKLTGEYLFRQEIGLFTIEGERTNLLLDMVRTARADLKPRDFAERHLVDELAISKWRNFRVALMEKAVFEHQDANFRPLGLRDTEGELMEPHEDVYNLARAHAPECDAVILAALSRLAARYFRQFCAALRLLIALRRGSRPPAAEGENAEPKSTTKSTRKAPVSCEPSPNTLPTM